MPKLFDTPPEPSVQGQHIRDRYKAGNPADDPAHDAQVPTTGRKAPAPGEHGVILGEGPMHHPV